MLCCGKGGPRAGSQNRDLLSRGCHCSASANITIEECGPGLSSSLYFSREVRNLDFLFNCLIFLSWVQFYLNAHIKWDDRCLTKRPSPPELEGKADQLLAFGTNSGDSRSLPGPGETLCGLLSVRGRADGSPARGRRWEQARPSWHKSTTTVFLVTCRHLGCRIVR